MTDQTYNINHDYSSCIQTASHFGYTDYVNICTGVTNIVPWGGADWTVAILLSLGGVGIISLIFALVFFIWSELWKDKR